SVVAVSFKMSVPAQRIAAERLVPGCTATPVPAKLAPMLAETAQAAFTREGWVWEPKLDGYRALAIVRGGKLELRSRRGLDLAADFPALAAEIAKQAVEGSVLDGEIVAFDASGRPSFAALQARAELKSARERAVADAATPAAFFAFDMPFFAGIDLRDAMQRDRRRYLAQCVMPSALVQVVHGDRDGERMRRAAHRRLAQGEADAHRRLRDRRLHARQGLAGGAGRASGGLLEGPQARVRLARGLRLRCEVARCAARAARPARA